MSTPDHIEGDTSACQHPHLTTPLPAEKGQPHTTETP